MAANISAFQGHCGTQQFPFRLNWLVSHKYMHLNSKESSLKPAVIKLKSLAGNSNVYYKYLPLSLKVLRLQCNTPFRQTEYSSSYVLPPDTPPDVRSLVSI